MSFPDLRQRIRSALARATASFFVVTVAVAQNVVWSTHDWTVSLGLPVPPFPEGWVDVKMPGGFPGAPVDARRTYVVGTVVAQAFPAAGPPPILTVPFSNFPAGIGNLAFPIPTSARQVVMLQCNQTTSAGSATQLWQRFFFGAPPAGGFPQANNARALSVWEADTDMGRRIAICGETYDAKVEFSQPSVWGGYGTFPGLRATGFIAVYDGAGTVLWTHHFFSGFPNQFSDNCAITDVSIRVDALGRDIVTYCGVFTHGDPGPGSELTPERPFDPPPGGFSGGATTQASGQFDGFVGRLVRAGGTTQRLFHSIVGGPGQDGVFGLCEIDESVFAVVGSTSVGSGQTGTFPIGVALPGPASVGAVLIFDATDAMLALLPPGSNVTPGNLKLAYGHRLGSFGNNEDTFACDVCVGRNVVTSLLGQVNMLYVVGTTNDPALTTDPHPAVPAAPSGWVLPPPPPPAPQSTMIGPTDGFVATIAVIPVPGPAVPIPAPWTFSYWGATDTGDDGLTGVNNWNEWSDQVGVVGYTRRNLPNSTRDIATSTFFLNTAYGSVVGTGNTAFPNNTELLHRIRDFVIVGPDTDTPAALGNINATTGYATISLAGASGGGIAVGNDGRTNVVGRSSPPIGTRSNYPLFMTAGRPGDAGDDAVRTELDILPLAFVGTGRTDGTGFQTGPVTYPGPANGGTTPACALSAFGARIGAGAPALQRMLIDYQGTAPGSGVSDAAILVSRLPAQPGSLALSTLQIGFPPAAPWLVLSGTEFWLGDPMASNLLMAELGQTNRPLRFRMPAFPATPPGVTQLSMQAVSLLVTPIGSGGCSSLWCASPAIYFSY